MKEKLERKFFEQLQLDELKWQDELNRLIEFMDKNLVKDNLSDSLEKFKAFDDFSHNEQQSIHEYITTFDAKLRKIEKKWPFHLKFWHLSF